MTTKKEYIDSLTTEQLRNILNYFSELLIDQSELNFVGEDEEDENKEPGFYCPHSGEKWNP